MGMMYDYVKSKATKKDMSPDEWLQNNAENAAKCRLVTHVGAFTSPEEKIFIDAKTNDSGEIYLTTGGLKKDKKDTVYNSAAYMAIAGLMLLELEDGQELWRHLKNDTPLIREEFSLFAIDYEEFRLQLLQAVHEDEPKETSTRMKQIYFPVADGKYHLLTPLTSSVLMDELKDRIENIRNKKWDAIKKGSPNYGSDYEIIDNDLICVLYGGTKPQNISTINSQNAGKAFMLPSLPPVLHITEHRPYKDFFYSLDTFAFKPLFVALQKLFKLDINNINIRQGIENLLFAIVQQIVDRIITLQALEPGWTEAASCRLPAYQKILLDGKNREIRQNQDAWFKATIDHTAKWFFATYDKIMRDEKIMFDDVVYSFFKKKIQIAFEENKEYLR